MIPSLHVRAHAIVTVCVRAVNELEARRVKLEADVIELIRAEGEWSTMLRRAAVLLEKEQDSARRNNARF